MRRAAALIAVLAGTLLAISPAAAQVVLPFGAALDVVPRVDPRALVTGLIRAVMGVVGILYAMRALRGVFLKLTQGGSEDAIAEASATLKGGIYGLLLIGVTASAVRPLVNVVANAAQTYL